jgi:deoxyadenosine/deoxycytidine kinase
MLQIELKENNKQMQKNIKIISIEGNIGSGKSTFINICKEYFQNLPPQQPYSVTQQTNLPKQYRRNVIFVDEPIALWEQIKDDTGENMVQKFYKDQQKYSFPFQVMAFISRLNYLNDAIVKAQAYYNTEEYIYIITERSLFTDCYVFAEMLKNSGNIEDVCFQIYLLMFQEFANKYSVTSIIYINTTPEVCYKRVNTRCRSGEEKISLNYLTECHEKHEEFIYEKLKQPSKFVVDGLFDINENPEIKEEWIRILQCCIDSV